MPSGEVSVTLFQLGGKRDKRAACKKCSKRRSKQVCGVPRPKDEQLGHLRIEASEDMRRSYSEVYLETEIDLASGLSATDAPIVERALNENDLHFGGRDT